MPKHGSKRKLHKKSKHAGVLALERNCWKSAKKSEAVSASIQCGTYLLAGGVIDQAMQREEMRGAMPDFDPNDQRRRFLIQTKILGLSEEQASSSLQALVGSMDSVLAGLMQAGMR